MPGKLRTDGTVPLLLSWGHSGSTPRSGRVLAAGKIPACQAESSQTRLVLLWRGWRCGQVLFAPRLHVPSTALAVSAVGLVLCRAEGISWATRKLLIKAEFKTSQRKPLKKKLLKILSASLLFPNYGILITKGIMFLWAVDV